MAGPTPTTLGWIIELATDCVIALIPGVGNTKRDHCLSVDVLFERRGLSGDQAEFSQSRNARGAATTQPAFHTVAYALR